jgi:rhodanese-related sulfurtransferase
MPYTNYNWIADDLAVGGLVEDAEDDLPFDAILSMETYGPAGIASLISNGEVEYQWRSIVDGFSHETNDDIVARFNDAADVINTWVSEGKNVLVHCTAGVSRSVTATIWYLMRYRGYTWDDALELIRRARPIAYPNLRFEIPLRMAAGEEFSEETLTERIAAYCQGFLPDYVVDPEQVRADLEWQGTIPARSTPHA